MRRIDVGGQDVDLFSGIVSSGTWCSSGPSQRDTPENVMDLILLKKKASANDHILSKLPNHEKGNVKITIIKHGGFINFVVVENFTKCAKVCGLFLCLIVLFGC